MYQINNITDDSYQSQNLILPDGTVISIVMYFSPMQYSWFFQSITYGAFVLNSLRISVSPNMLHQFRNKLPFGIGCFTTEGREATQQQDFSQNNFQMYVLTAAEVQVYTEYLNGQVSS